MTTAERLINSGFTRGRKKGLEEGRARGEMDGLLNSIQAFLSAGVDWDTITKATGYTEERFKKELSERTS